MLSDKRKFLLDYIKAHANYLNANHVALDIYRGNLLKYVTEIMRSSLSPQYFEKIEHRILPVNIMQRFIGKVSTTYSEAPTRTAADESQQKFLDEYVALFDINNKGVIADEYANLFKGFAWKPYINNKGQRDLRVLPFDRFLVYSDSSTNPDEETIFIEIVKTEDNKNIYFAYTDNEFDAFDSDANGLSQYLIDNQGINPIGTIPFVYGKRVYGELLPTQDTDLVAFTKVIPTILSDVGGALMFQCFAIMYGVNVDANGITMAPNAFWNIKSDGASEHPPQIGTIQPQVDSEKALSFVISNFVLFLETKGIRIGSIGSMDSGNAASGIAKIIDEMDVFEIKKKSIVWFEHDEKELWNEKLAKIHNYWVQTKQINEAMIPENFKVEVKFQKPEPMQSRSSLLDDLKKERDLGIITKEQMIMRAFPEIEDDELKSALADESYLIG